MLPASKLSAALEVTANGLALGRAGESGSAELLRNLRAQAFGREPDAIIGQPALATAIGNSELRDVSVEGQVPRWTCRSPSKALQAFYGSAATDLRQWEQSLAGPRRRVGDSPKRPAAAERQVPRCSGQPPQELANVRYRRPPTFAGQIRTAADSLDQSLRMPARWAVHPIRNTRECRLGVVTAAPPGQPSALLTAEKSARAAVRLHRAKGRTSIRATSPEALPVAARRGVSGGVRHLLPVAGSQLDELATQRLELGGTVVVLDALREVRDGVDQAVGA